MIPESRLGQLVRYVPVAVVHGFTVGMGAIIVVAQLPRAFEVVGGDRPGPKVDTIDQIDAVQ